MRAKLAKRYKVHGTGPGTWKASIYVIIIIIILACTLPFHSHLYLKTCVLASGLIY